MRTVKKMLMFLHRRVVTVVALVYLMHDLFTTPVAAPIPSPRTSEPTGQLRKYADTSNLVAISGGRLVFTAGASIEDPAYYFTQSDGSGFSRVAGLCYKVKVNLSTNTWHFMGWYSSTVIQAAANLNGIQMNGVQMNAWETSASIIYLGVDIVLGTEYQFAFVTRGTGRFMFVKGGVWTDWTLIWASDVGNSATLYPGFGNRNTAGYYEDASVVVLPGAFSTDDGIDSVNVTAPASGLAHVATADHIADLNVTAPNPLSGTGELRTRVNGTTYWRIYVNSAGAFRVDSVNNGIATNRVNVAGVVAAGATIRLREIADGSVHNFYTQSGVVWTKRGAAVTLALNDTMTDINATYTDYTPGDLTSYPRRSADFAVLDTI